MCSGTTSTISSSSSYYFSSEKHAFQCLVLCETTKLGFKQVTLFPSRLNFTPSSNGLFTFPLSSYFHFHQVFCLLSPRHNLSNPIRTLVDHSVKGLEIGPSFDPSSCFILSLKGSPSPRLAFQQKKRSGCAASEQHTA